MDPRESMAMAPPRTKSLRHQRASNGANVIKAYVQQSELRREQSKFHSASSRLGRAGSSLAFRSPRAEFDERWEDTPCNARSTRVTMAEGLFSSYAQGCVSTSNQMDYELDNAHALDALFSDRRVRRSRRPSVAPTPPHGGQLVLNAAGNGQQGGHDTAGKPVFRRRLQMELLSPNVHASLGHNPMSCASHNRPVTTTLVPHHPRARHNLGAKLDAIAKSPMLGRRKVVQGSDNKAVKNLARSISPRHLNSPQGHSGESQNNSSGPKDASASEIEVRVMAAFRQIVRLWRERKRRAEAAAVNRMNGGAGGLTTGTGRNGSKFRKDLAAQQSNVVGIISRRLIREIPALKFFDENSDTAVPSAGPGVVIGLTEGLGGPPISTQMVAERSRPRGVCYTLDAFGCRKIKMQSSTTAATASRHQSDNKTSNKSAQTSNEELTLEKAMSRSLHRKMARRVKSRRQSILRISDEFSKSRNELTMKLRSQLALQRAQIEKMFGKRLKLLLSEDTSLPPYQAQKELHLARVRCRKANLLEKCQTLRVLGFVLRHVETVGETSGVEVSTGELHFLDLLRCVVEENQVLTAIISKAIRKHMRPQDLNQPLILELFRILDIQTYQHERDEQA